MNPRLRTQLEAIGMAALGAGIPFLLEAMSDDKITRGEITHAAFLALAGALITLLAYLRQPPRTVEQAQQIYVKAVAKEDAAQ
jgi:hypothetical protein